MLNLLDYTLDELQSWIKENNEPAFRAKQVFSWIYKKVYNFNDMNNIPKSLKERLENSFIIDMPKIERVYESSIDGTGIFDYIKDNYKGVIIESFGIGGIPNEGNNNNIAGKIYELIQAGVAVVITTQCIYEGIDLDVYEVGQTMAKLNVIMSGDMTTEALTMKLMWALAHYDNIDDIKKYIENAYFADRSY